MIWRRRVIWGQQIGGLGRLLGLAQDEFPRVDRPLPEPFVRAQGAPPLTPRSKADEALESFKDRHLPIQGCNSGPADADLEARRFGVPEKAGKAHRMEERQVRGTGTANKAAGVIQKGGSQDLGVEGKRT